MIELYSFINNLSSKISMNLVLEDSMKAVYDCSFTNDNYCEIIDFLENIPEVFRDSLKFTRKGRGSGSFNYPSTPLNQIKDTFKKDFNKNPCTEVTAMLVFDKSSLSRNLLNLIPNRYRTHIILLFSKDCLIDFFKEPLTKFDSYFQSDKLNIVLSNLSDDCSYSNDYMLITNKLDISQLSNFDLDMIMSSNNSIFKYRRQYGSWNDEIKNVTPKLFYFENQDIPLELSSSLNRLVWDSILVYLSCRTEIIGDSIYCSYDSFMNNKIKLISQNEFTLASKDISIFYKIFRFVYSEGFNSKANIVKNLFGLYLGSDSEQNYLMLSLKASSIHNALLSNYQMFSEERIEYWFEERRKTYDYINSLISSISSRIEDVNSLLFKLIISSLAIYLGSIIPYLTNQNYHFLKYSFLIIGIVLIILFIFSAASTYTSYRNIIIDYNNFIDSESKIKLLSDEEMSSIVGSKINRRKTHFWVSLTFVSIIYLATVLLVYYAFNNFDSLMPFLLPKN